RTFWGLLQENPGFNPSRIVTSYIYLPHPNNPDLDRYANLDTFNSFVRESVRRVSTIPGVDHAAITSDLPVTHLSRRSAVKIEGRPDESGKGLFFEITSVTPEYFKALQASLVRGRYFTEDEDAGKQPVAIIDESTARTYWPDRDPIGRRLSMKPFSRAAANAADPPWCTVVGVIKDIKSDGLDQSGAPHIYRPMYQFPGPRTLSLGLTVRTSLSATSLEPLIRREIQTVDPNLPIFNVRTMHEVIDGSLALRRFSAELVGLFAVAALLLASVGIYGLLAYMVGQRAQEIGVRMALGAQRNDILKLVLTQGALLAGVGICVGLILAAVAAPLIAALLYGIRAHDPIVFLAVPLILLGVSFTASYIPALRAARISPIVALREG
ncbi:MAG TPA: FtsX-like permease family protein, partial [Candidatus Angelobacter sp.]|nr:FtsX-like permease family protein [Candidatus Angelobacter sp.]